MAEIWAAASAAGAVITGYAASKKAKEDRKHAKEDRKEMTRDDAKYSSILSRFEAEQEDYYNQLNRQRKQRGLAQFRQFSTVNQFAPQYLGDNTEIVVPERPDINKIMDEVDPQEVPVKSAKGKKSTLEKLDPLGSKIIKKLF